MLGGEQEGEGVEEGGSREVGTEGGRWWGGVLKEGLKDGRMDGEGYLEVERCSRTFQ